MAWLRKKADPISERARVLNSEIASLEAEIKRLDARLNREAVHPKLRSTAVPHGATISHAPLSEEPVGVAAPSRHEPVFEEVRLDSLTARQEAANPQDLYNEMGVRKFDLPALFRRLRTNFHGPTTSNPKLVSYLAAGGIQGLRPMRYEKRVARNRFIVLVTFLFLVLLGILIAFVRIR